MTIILPAHILIATLPGKSGKDEKDADGPNGSDTIVNIARPEPATARLHSLTQPIAHNSFVLLNSSQRTCHGWKNIDQMS